MAGTSPAVKVNLKELGVYGYRHDSSRVFDELLPELSGNRAFLIYRQMRENDAVVSAVFLAIEQILRSVEWTVIPDGSQEEADFVSSVMDDMSHTWSDFIAHVTTYLQYGFAVFEIVYKLRLGGTEEDPAERRSRYNDGKVGWRKLALRHQQTIQEWILDESGGVHGVIQWDPNTGRRIQIPITKLLHFVTRPGSPVGFSLLRGAYRPWKFKKFIEEIEGIGVERDLAGLPYIQCPENVDIFDPENEQLYAALTELLRNVRLDKYHGIILPSGYEFKLIASSGTKQFDTNRIINRYDQRIALSVLAQFVLLGVERVGSYALANQQKDLFTTAIEGWLVSIEDVINRFGVWRLLRLNGMKTFPRIKAKPIVRPTAEDIALMLSRLVPAGVIFPDSALEEYLRHRFLLPSRQGSSGLEDLEAESRMRAIEHLSSAFSEGDLDEPSLLNRIMDIVGEEEKAVSILEEVRNHYFRKDRMAAYAAIMKAKSANPKRES